MKKGNWYYEMQVLMFVIMWQHDMSHKPRSERGMRIGRLFVWRDTAWNIQREIRKIRRHLR